MYTGALPAIVQVGESLIESVRPQGTSVAFQEHIQIYASIFSWLLLGCTVEDQLEVICSSALAVLLGWSYSSRFSVVIAV